jgi:hypothetical protein
VLYPIVDKLAADAKNIFFKNRSIHTIPPNVVITLWETWLYSVVYYAEFFEVPCSLMHEIDRSDAFSVAVLQEIFVDSDELEALESDLPYVNANFRSLFQSVT